MNKARKIQTKGHVDSAPVRQVFERAVDAMQKGPPVPRALWDRKLAEQVKELYRTPRQLRLRKAVLWHMLETDIIIDAAKHGNAEDRRRAAELLGEAGSRGPDPKTEKRIVSTLMGMLNDPWDSRVSFAAVEAMKMMVERGVRNELRESTPQLKKEAKEHFNHAMRVMIMELLEIRR